MPVPAQATLFNESVANGVTTSFPYQFMIASADDLAVELDGVATTTGFTVMGVGDANGGDIVFSVPPANGVKVLRYLDSELNRAEDYQQFGDFNADTVDREFDRLWLAMQSHALKLGLCLRMPISSASGELPSPVANHVIGWNEDGTGFENFAPVDNTLLSADLANSQSGKGAALIGGLIADDVTISVPAQYATIAAAFSYLRTKTIVRGATVTVQVADGTHDYTGASVSLNHPQGSQIRLLGNVTTPTNCVLTWTNTTTGIDGLTVTDGHTLGYIDGFHITRTAHAGLKISTGLLADNGSTIICGAHMKVTNHYYGIASRMRSYIKADDAIVDGAGDVGIWAFVDSSVDCSSAVVTNTADPLQSLGFGIQAEYGSSVNCDLANSSGNKIGGIAALSGSNVRANSATASSNTGSGLFARDGGTIEAHSATATGNTRYGIEELTSGAVYGNSMTYAGTLGARAPVAMLNYDTALGARLSSRSGALRIDTEGANPIYFNTSGGLQLEVGHAASAVNRARIKGAATGGSISFEAASSTDTNVSVNLRGQGTGSVFIGNSQANYARFNGASAGNTPAIYAEGSDTNIDLLLSGKGTGVVRLGSWTTNADAAVNGYLTIKDSAGNTRKLATIA